MYLIPLWHVLAVVGIDYFIQMSDSWSLRDRSHCQLDRATLRHSIVHMILGRKEEYLFPIQ